MTSPVSGWYPDPSGQPGERFWNGSGWTADTRQAPTAPAPQAWDGFGNPAAPRDAAQPAQVPAYGAAPPPYGSSPYGSPPYATQYPQQAPRQQASFLARNSLSFATIGVTVVYLLILVFAHFAILGILPLFLAIRAVGRKEPLAWAAVAIGVVALVFGIYEFTR